MSRSDWLGPYVYPKVDLSGLKKMRLGEVPEGGLFYPIARLYQSGTSGVKGCLFLVTEKDRSGQISVEIREGPSAGDKLTFWHQQWVKIPAEENTL